MDYIQVITLRIQSLCKQRGISYNKLAKMSGVNQSTIDNIMREVTKNPRVQSLHKIAIAFNMTLAELLDYEELNEFAFENDDVDEQQ